MTIETAISNYEPARVADASKKGSVIKNLAKLGVSMSLDTIGCLSYFLGPIGEASDFVMAPIQYKWIKAAYGDKYFSKLAAIEELLPLTDIIPTCTIAHVYNSMKRDDKNASR